MHKVFVSVYFRESAEIFIPCVVVLSCFIFVDSKRYTTLDESLVTNIASTRIHLYIFATINSYSSLQTGSCALCIT